jgi:non-ribosomal peptide synthetase component F
VILEQMVDDPGQRLSELTLLTEAERRQLLVEWNDTRRAFPDDYLVTRLFERQAEQAPDAVALVYEDRQLSYGELNRRANQLAHHLRGLGVGPETPVALCLERSPEMVVGLLGTLKAGGFYVPLDPAYPPERLAYMLEDSGATVLLTQQRLQGNLPRHSAHALHLDSDWEQAQGESAANLEPLVSSQNLAYVIYTSGSTGKPKGVAVTLQNIVRLVKQTNYVDLRALG